MEASKFLTGNTIPDYVVKLPEEILETPLGIMMSPVIDKLMEGVQQQLVQQERKMQARAGKRVLTPPNPSVMTWGGDTRCTSTIFNKLRESYRDQLSAEDQVTLQAMVCPSTTRHVYPLPSQKVFQNRLLLVVVEHTIARLGRCHV